MIKVGLGAGFYRFAEFSSAEVFRRILEVQKDACEMMLGRVEYVEAMNEKAMELFEQFEYRSIHLPCDVRYPSVELDEVISKLWDVADKTHVHTLVLHPDLVDDWDWVKNNFDSRLAVENMDTWHDFGQTLKDMMTVFDKVPYARFVFDVNHLYTIDPSMALASDFYKHLGDRLAHYHISGVKGGEDRHIWLKGANQDIIAQAASDVTKPFIIESTAYGAHQIEHPEEELEYIKGLLSVLPTEVE